MGVEDGCGCSLSFGIVSFARSRFSPFHGHSFQQVAPRILKRSGASDALDPLATNAALEAEEDASCIGGLRSAKLASLRVPGWSQVGKSIRSVLMPIVEENMDRLDFVLQLCGTRDAVDIPDAVIDLARVTLAECLSTSRDSLLEMAIAKAQDPDIDTPNWLRKAAPLGIECPIVPRGVFPLISDLDRQKAARSYPPKQVEPQPFKNYPSYVAHQEDADREFAKDVEAGYVEVFPDRPSLRKACGRPLPARIGVIVKEKEGGQESSSHP